MVRHALAAIMPRDEEGSTNLPDRRSNGDIHLVAFYPHQ